LRIKEQETRLTLQEHNDDDDDEKNGNVVQVNFSMPILSILYHKHLFCVMNILHCIPGKHEKCPLPLLNSTLPVSMTWWLCHKVHPTA
jgi:hypothetical protein